MHRDVFAQAEHRRRRLHSRLVCETFTARIYWTRSGKDMSSCQITRYIEPTQDAGRAFVMRRIKGSIVMLNLLRFRDVADYSATPELAPAAPISGAEAFRRYVEHTLPHLRDSGGELLFMGSGGAFLIGPPGERWDLAMLVRHHSVETFLRFASNEAYLGGLGHRRAAIEDSRLLPLLPVESG